MSRAQPANVPFFVSIEVRGEHGTSVAPTHTHDLSRAPVSVSGHRVFSLAPAAVSSSSPIPGSIDGLMISIFPAANTEIFIASSKITVSSPNTVFVSAQDLLINRIGCFPVGDSTRVGTLWTATFSPSEDSLFRAALLQIEASSFLHARGCVGPAMFKEQEQKYNTTQSRFELVPKSTTDYVQLHGRSVHKDWATSGDANGGKRLSELQQQLTLKHRGLYDIWHVAWRLKQTTNMLKAQPGILCDEFREAVRWIRPFACPRAGASDADDVFWLDETSAFHDARLSWPQAELIQYRSNPEVLELRLLGAAAQNGSLRAALLGTGKVGKGDNSNNAPFFFVHRHVHWGWGSMVGVLAEHNIIGTNHLLHAALPGTNVEAYWCPMLLPCRFFIPDDINSVRMQQQCLRLDLRYRDLDHITVLGVVPLSTPSTMEHFFVYVMPDLRKQLNDDGTCKLLLNILQQYLPSVSGQPELLRFKTSCGGELVEHIAYKVSTAFWPYLQDFFACAGRNMADEMVSELWRSQHLVSWFCPMRVQRPVAERDLLHWLPLAEVASGTYDTIVRKGINTM